MADQTTPTPTPTRAGFTLELDESSGRLYGVVPKLDADAKLTTNITAMPQLRAAISAIGCDDCYFPTDSLSLFLKKLDRHESGRYVLAERRDASLSLQVSKDKLQLRIQALPSQGGVPLSIELIQQQLAKLNIAEQTIKSDRLLLVATATEAIDIVVAEAIPPQNGYDTTFIPLTDSRLIVEHNSNSGDVIDLRQNFEFLTVNENVPVMQRIPATAGIDGMNVEGKAITAKAGKDLKFDKKLEGVKVSDDGLHLISIVKGHPIVGPRSVRVDPVMKLDAVNIHTGHIRFDGSLFVKGDIESHFKVDVTGDVIVAGAIYKTQLKAGGSVQVKGGIQADHIGGEHGCHISSGGDLTAKFLNQVEITALGNIHISEYIMHSQITAHGSVNVGQDRGRGIIIGGETVSHCAIHAQILGSDAFVKTNLRLITNKSSEVAARRLNENLARRKLEAIQLTNILKKITNNETPTMLGEVQFDKTEKIRNTLVSLQLKIAELENALPAIEAQTTPTDELMVTAKKRIYPNIQVHINSHHWRCEAALGATCVQQRDKLVVASHLEPSKTKSKKPK
ncbi:DUF342 domain-containing protein [Teredinibacter waterburyi]|uniref:DUF342 domain-containing protein n=1 Tax=Teredinibacter waterburyi TaxID=1500538 RepID=UPI00165F33CB|nr:FapA family protein [Teredinibacter waterburyi]